MKRKFFYLIRQDKKRIRKGIIYADSLSEAIESLEKQGVNLVSIRERKIFNWTIKRRKVSREDIIFFTRYLQFLTEKGIPIVKGMKEMIGDIPRDTLQEMVLNIRREIEKGKNLSKVMENYKSVFPSFYINLIKLGENLNNFPEFLQIGSELLEFEDTLLNRTKTALLYPGIFLLVSFLSYCSLSIFLFHKIFPTFTKILNEYQILPSSPFYFSPVFFLLISLIFILIFVFIGKKAEIFKTIFFIPLFSSIEKQVSILSFIKLLGLFIKKGLPLKTSMLKASDLLPYKKKFDVLQGVKLLDSGYKPEEVMEKIKIFTFTELWYLKNGFKNGELGKIMEEIFEMRKISFQTRTGMMIAVLQPIYVIIGGIIVAFTFSCVFGSLLKLINSLLLMS